MDPKQKNTHENLLKLYAKKGNEVFCLKGAENNANTSYTRLCTRK
jgi:hypothetical protein